MRVQERPTPWCRNRAAQSGMGLSSSWHTTARLYPSAPCPTGMAQLWACPLGYEIPSQLCELCLYSSVQQHPCSGMQLCMQACQPCGVHWGWHCQGRTGMSSWCSGTTHCGWGSPQQGPQCCGGLPLLQAGWSPRLISVHPSEHPLPMSQKLQVGCLTVSPFVACTNSFFPGGLLAWFMIREDNGQGGLPALQSLLLHCHLGSRETGECPAHSRAKGGLTISHSAGWSISQPHC